MDFSWPIDKTWHGYVNPHFVKCEACDGDGYTTARERLSDLVSLLMLSGSDSLRGENHPYFQHIQRGVYGFNSSPSKDLHDLTKGLAGRASDSMGHDACDRWSATKKIIEAAGLDPETWGICQECGGHGNTNESRPLYDAWEDFEPPVGDGYQMWENTTEGSPQSPVFPTLDLLCEWLEKTNASVFGNATTTKEKWKSMLDDGFVHHSEGNMIFI